MASWKDGPEYAPTQAPAAFELPDVAPLPPAEPHVNLAVGQPDERPESYERTERQPDLAAVGPGTGPRRDPQQPYAVAPVLTGARGGAWGATHRSLAPGADASPAEAAFDPRQPFRIQSRVPDDAAAPRPGRDFAPPTGRPVVLAPPPAGPASLAAAPAWAPGAFPGGRSTAPGEPIRFGFGALVGAVTPGVWLGYGLAILLGGFVALAPAGFLVGFFSSFAIRHRISTVRLTGAMLLALQTFVVFVAMTLDGADLTTIWGVWNLLAFGSAAIALVVDVLAVAAALRRGEPPQRV